MVSGLTLETRKGAPLIRLMRVYPRRRDPVSRDRYRAIARGAGVRAPVSPRWLHASLALALGIAALVALPLASGAIGAGLGQLVTEVQSAIPLLQGRGSIDLPAGGNISIGAAPIADSLPAYTRHPHHHRQRTHRRDHTRGRVHRLVLRDTRVRPDRRCLA